MTNTEICKRLESGQNDITMFLSGSPDEAFFKGSNDQWSPAHHVAHLTFTHTRVAGGLKAEDRLPDYKEVPRTYEEIRDTYKIALQRATSGGFLQNNPFAAKPGADKEITTHAFLQASQALREATTEYSEVELDTKGMPHPLLGLLSVREMLLFMIYHDQHHLLGIQKLVKD
jgi:hypothetical protein